MITLVGVSFLVSCSDNNHERPQDGQEQQSNNSGGGMMERMAGAAVAGAAAGTAGAVAHRATDHLINKHQERKAHRQTRPRTYNHRRR